jgi:hypothetical protein
MSFLDFAQRLKKVVEVLNATREEQSIIIAKETVASIRLRVQNDKVDAEGVSFGSYSLGYEIFRTLNNQPIDAKNYTFTKDMWRDTGITDVQDTGGTTTVTIGGQTDRAERLMEYNTTRDGPILEASEEEEEFIREAHEERIINIIDNLF